MKYLRLFEDHAPDYTNSKTAIIALFNRRGQVLVLQRGDTAPWMPSAWSLVGGGVDEGETPEEAVRRECVEEIGLHPKSVRLVTVRQTPDIGQIFYFVGKVPSEDVVLDWENQDHRFLSKNEVDTLDFVPYVTDYLHALVAGA